MSKVSWASPWARDFIGLKIIIEFSSSKKRCIKPWCCSTSALCGLREVVNLCTTHSNLHNPFHFFDLPTYSPCPDRLAHPLLNPQVISPAYHHRHEYTRMCWRCVVLVSFDVPLSPWNETNSPLHPPARKNPPRNVTATGAPQRKRD